MTSQTNAPFIPFPIVDAQGRPTADFNIFWQSAFNSAVANALAAQNAASAAGAAQGTADVATATAMTAQATANAGVTAAAAAQATANAALTQAEADLRYVLDSVGPSFSAATGTASRATFATYSAPTISNPPTQTEVQNIANATQVLSRTMKALIDDLLANKALTS